MEILPGPKNQMADLDFDLSNFFGIFDQNLDANLVKSDEICLEYELNQFN